MRAIPQVTSVPSPKMRKYTHLRKNLVDGSGVVRLAVSLRATRPHAHKLADIVVRILRMRFAEYPTGAVEQTRGLVEVRDGALREGREAARAAVDVSLRPSGDGRGPAGEDHGSAHHTNSRGDVDELDVVEHQRSC